MSYCFFLYWFSTLMFVLLSVCFYTLFERKLLGYMQYRQGPGKVLFLGLGQSFSDAIKLVYKSCNSVLYSFNFLYWFSPLFSFFIFLLCCCIIPSIYNVYFLSLSMIYFFCISSLGVYSGFFIGWSSKSLYSFLGSMRIVAQSMSYEVSMVFLVIFCLVYGSGFSVYCVSWFYYFLLFLFLFFLFLLSMVAETKRSPFDFAEGESEMVSGFKMEFGSLWFAFMMLMEYGFILLFCYMSVFLYFKGNFFFFFILSFFFVWIRGILPRFRYDFLMELCWIVMLPIVCLFLFILFF